MTFGREPRTLICAVGHKLTGVNRITLTVDDGNDVIHSFNYCPICFGKWAAEQWPLTIEDIIAGSKE